jgi:hypothetical protein
MKIKKQTSIKLAAATLAAGLAASTVQASTIDWGSGAQNISGDSDVSVYGTLVDAFAFSTADSAAATTVNGVTFAPWAFPALDLPDYTGQTSTSLGNYSFSEDAGFLTAYDSLGWGSGPITGLSGAYGNLLISGASSTYYSTLSLTMSGLTVGQTYQFQWWDNNSGFEYSQANGFTPGYSTATAGNTVGLNANDGVSQGTLGQYAIGTFTADAATQEIDFNGSSFYGTDPMLNAFQLRELTPTPEPSTWALAAVGLVIFGRKFYPRRSRHQPTF